jgi:hypothetical protein
VYDRKNTTEIIRQEMVYSEAIIKMTTASNLPHED